jgi:hypothetical protein
MRTNREHFVSPQDKRRVGPRFSTVEQTVHRRQQQRKQVVPLARPGVFCGIGKDRSCLAA